MRHITPLVKQPGILVVTDQGLYFQPLHNLTGGAAVRFHPIQVRACHCSYHLEFDVQHPLHAGIQYRRRVDCRKPA